MKTLETKALIKQLKKHCKVVTNSYFTHWYKLPKQHSWNPDLYTVELSIVSDRETRTVIKVPGKLTVYGDQTRPESGFVSIGVPDQFLTAIACLPSNVEKLYFEMVLGNDSQILEGMSLTNEYLQLIAVLPNAKELAFGIYHNVLRKYSMARFASQSK